MHPTRMIVLVLTVSAVSAGDFATDGCEEFEQLCNEESSHSCAECIDAHYCCAWLYDKDVDTPRCTIKRRVGESDSVVYGGVSRIEVVKDDGFSVSSPMEDEPAVQIRPQRVKAYLRRGAPVSFDLTYKATPNYALDLYFLMDLTYSMQPHKENLSKLGAKLAEKLKNMTTNYKIAFGFYSDKVASPYYKMEEVYLRNPCHQMDFGCVPGFNFNHAFNFSQDLDEFTKQVDASQHTANVDDLESGLDALMQIILCQKELSWRKHSRKIVLIATNSLLHVAGDGKLSGATARFKDACALRAQNNYLVYEGLENDYPSAEEIYRRLLKHKMNVLFAVGEPFQEFYKAFKNILDGVAYIGILKDDPENVLRLVEKGYMELSKKVHFNAITNDNIKVSFKTDCNSKRVSDKSFCNNIEIATEYTFNVQLELLSFPSNKSSTAVVRIEEMNLEEYLEIEVEYLGAHCACSGPEEGDRVDHGTYECGKYVCDHGWTGEKCTVECDHTKGRYENETYTSTTCFNKGEFNTETCNCECYEGYMGKYCQYKQCKRNKLGKICSDHGTCNAGVCVCVEGYAGNICECPLTTETCKAYETAAICSGRGECVCGMCKCNYTEGISYAGRFCEKCRGCENLCSKYDEDIIALTDGRQLDRSKYDRYEIAQVQHLQTDDDTSKCRTSYFLNDDECIIEYTYEILQNSHIKVNYKKYCQTFMKAEVVSLILASAVSLVLILFLFAWKGFNMYKDKKEWQAYEKHLTSTSFTDENPLFKSPITTVELGSLRERMSID